MQYIEIDCISHTEYIYLVNKVDKIAKKLHDIEEIAMWLGKEKVNKELENARTEK